MFHSQVVVDLEKGVEKNFQKEGEISIKSAVKGKDDDVDKRKKLQKK